MVVARHSSPRPTPPARSSGAPRFGAPDLGLLAGGMPALAGVPGAGPAAWGRGAAFLGGTGRAAALPMRPPSDLQPMRPPSSSGPSRPDPSSSGPRPGPSSSGPSRPGPEQPRRRAPGALTGRLAVTAVAAGAIATAGHALATDVDAPTAETRADLALTSAGSPDAPTAGDALDAATTGVLAVSPGSDRSAARHAASLAKARKVADAAAAREAAARAPKFVLPAQGRFTSGFGARWGTSHKGVDIANAIGTPIVSVADGTVIESGPASGFGMWVRVQLADGTINVYGHVNRSYVTEGQKVRAGEQIAEIGNRGESTGPHLHFEVWTPGGTKINPLPWLASRGISLGAEKD
jgi:murein DD-endopeptidase MepM/ murein hydrolase activator NlpD